MGFVSKVDVASLQAAAFVSVAAADQQTTNGGLELCPSFSALKCASARCIKNSDVSIQKTHKVARLRQPILPIFQWNPVLSALDVSLHCRPLILPGTRTLLLPSNCRRWFN